MEHKSFKNVLDSLDYTIIDDYSQFLGIENLKVVRKYLLDKRDKEYNHVDMFELPYIVRHINYIIENNFGFNNERLKREYIKLRKQLIKWFIECNTQDENNDGDSQE